MVVGVAKLPIVGRCKNQTQNSRFNPGLCENQAAGIDAKRKLAWPRSHRSRRNSRKSARPLNAKSRSRSRGIGTPACLAQLSSVAGSKQPSRWTCTSAFGSARKDSPLCELSLLIAPARCSISHPYRRPLRLMAGRPAAISAQAGLSGSRAGQWRATSECQPAPMPTRGKRGTA